MANQFNNVENNEIDLHEVSVKVKGFFSRINDSFFTFILFLKRNIIIIAILIAAGIALGMYMDRSTQVYKHKMFVIPNFDSVDYLYAEVEHLNTKIKEGDLGFFEQIGIKNPERFGNIEIEPVVDIYNYITEQTGLKNDVEEENVKFLIFRLMTDNGDINKVMEEEITGRNYKKHLITITTKKSVNRADLIEPLLGYLNSSKYFKTIQEESIKNLETKIAANDTVIKQVQMLLNDFSSNKGKISTANFSLSNENMPLDKVLKIQDQLVREQAQNRINKINYTKIIKDSGVMSNIKNFSTTTGRMKFIIPIVFVLLYIFVFAFRSYYRSQMRKRNLITNA